jgi:hypothetical protein
MMAISAKICHDIRCDFRYFALQILLFSLLRLLLLASLAAAFSASPSVAPVVVLLLLEQHKVHLHIELEFLGRTEEHVTQQLALHSVRSRAHHKRQVLVPVLTGALGVFRHSGSGEDGVVLVVMDGIVDLRIGRVHGSLHYRHGLSSE